MVGRLQSVITPSRTPRSPRLTISPSRPFGQVLVASHRRASPICPVIALTEVAPRLVVNALRLSIGLASLEGILPASAPA